MPSEVDLGPSDPMVDALLASARRLGAEAEAEPPDQQAQRQTRIWTSVTRVTASGAAPQTRHHKAVGGWVWAALLAVACAGAGGAITWLLLG